jgi:hypothetical protein
VASAALAETARQASRAAEPPSNEFLRKSLREVGPLIFMLDFGFRELLQDGWQRVQKTHSRVRRVSDFQRPPSSRSMAPLLRPECEFAMHGLDRRLPRDRRFDRTEELD